MTRDAGLVTIGDHQRKVVYRGDADPYEAKAARDCTRLVPSPETCW